MTEIVLKVSLNFSANLEQYLRKIRTQFYSLSNYKRAFNLKIELGIKFASLQLFPFNIFAILPCVGDINIPNIVYK